ncbi:Retrovirus-related Pol polyprotein from transposon TNT 1-94 [Gossypium australe]|uniref:Retrovirus-related Pol polyprotein from transposon TNT 1-94 n=1 Tax=Gossypium australe TaxID=47621 RepID=A0A5B6VCZ3_9ROSI|nr:Retrovirus-related Pol polyprotein from transposon TNT 1-94 [Gossypium australe]
MSNAVESLMFAMVCTRPDISHVVSVVSRYMARLDKYLKGTSDICLTFRRSSESLVDYVDSDYARDLNQKKSLTCYLFAFGDCTISWKDTLQAIVTLSTIEAKYMAITEVVKEVIWLRGLFGELDKEKIIVVYCDSQSAIHLIENQMHHKRMKNIGIRYHFV